MAWYAQTFEMFAVTPVRPAPPERVDARRRRQGEDERDTRIRESGAIRRRD